ncbi:MAG: formate dehydrogenase subunit alpha [Candidatus Brocadiia bacterium]
MTEMNLTIDDVQVTVPEGKTVLEAAEKAGIYIPTLCNDEDLAPYGACRLCIVEIEGMKGLPTSCTTRAADGMVVHTDTEQVNEVRRTICQMLIADHSSDCLTCASNQECELQEVARHLGVTEQTMDATEREREVDDSNPFFERDMSRCILCLRCVRACHEVRGVGAIEVVGRGYESKIGTFDDMPLSESVCESCAECIARCPTGALSVKSETMPATRWVSTTCPYCGCGCGLDLGIRGDEIVQVRGEESHVVNKGSVCVKGRFGLDFVGSPDRLSKPLIRRNGQLKEAEWDEALDLVANRLSEIKDEYGSDALAGLSSAKCTNEENYVFQKFVRAAFGTNSVDHCARLCHSSTVAGLARAFGSGAMTNSIAEIENADCIFVTGSNTTEAHPIIALRVKDAVEKHGAKLIVADPRRIDLTRFADIHMSQQSGTDVALFNAMMHVIIEEGLVDEEYVEERTRDWEKVREAVADCTPEWAEPITGVPADDIREAARIYGKADRSSIIYSMGITQHTTGTDNVLSLANMAMLTGNVGRESTGVNPLRGQNNVQGACDLGALPNVYPGYQKVDDPEIHQKFEDAWGTKLSTEPGLTVVEIMEAAYVDDVRGLYIMGENPMLSDPNVNHVEEALKNLDFLVVQDIFLSETAQLADVVLPAACFAEKNGSYTNTERRVQRIRKAIEPPGEARVDYDILCDVSTRMGYEMGYEGAGEILDEIAELTPIYAGMSFERIDDVGLQWPCESKDDPGTMYLHKGNFRQGYGQFYGVDFREADELPDEEYPLILTTGRLLEHFHTGTLSRQTPGLEEIAPPTPVEIHPEDAQKLGLEDGEEVEVSSRRGTVRCHAVVTKKSPKGTVFMPFHYREAPANRLTNDALDPIAKIPEYKVCAVRVAKPE